MKRTAAALASAAALLAAGSAMLAAPGQSRPGQITEARVWIENRNVGEAIPVTLEGLGALRDPLTVAVAGTPTVAVAPSTIVKTVRARQIWEHRAVSVAAGADLDAALKAAGSDGWEAVGLQPAAQNGMTILLKRPR